MTGFEACVQLRELYLSHNGITRIEVGCGQAGTVWCVHVAVLILLSGCPNPCLIQGIRCNWVVTIPTSVTVLMTSQGKCAKNIVNGGKVGLLCNERWLGLVYWLKSCGLIADGLLDKERPVLINLQCTGLQW